MRGRIAALEALPPTARDPAELTPLDERWWELLCINHVPLYDARWPEWLAAWVASGEYEAEPDFSTVGDVLSERIKAAVASGEWNPPADFHSNHVERGWLVQRLDPWRQRRFPELAAPVAAVFGVLDRRRRGLPPLAFEEFDELVRWYSAHEARLRTIVGDKSVEFRDPVRFNWIYVPRWPKPHGVCRSAGLLSAAAMEKTGPLAEDAGLHAEMIRQLKAMFPGATP